MAALAAAAPGFQFGGRARQVLLVAALARLKFPPDMGG
jgi:hypothetical protein